MDAAAVDCSFPSADRRADSLARRTEALEAPEDDADDAEGGRAEVGGVGTRKSFGMAPPEALRARWAPAERGLGVETTPPSASPMAGVIPEVVDFLSSSSSSSSSTIFVCCCAESTT